MKGHLSPTKTDYRIRLGETEQGTAASPKHDHEYNMPCNSPENINSESDTLKKSAKATEINGPDLVRPSNKAGSPLAALTLRSKSRSHGDARRNLKTPFSSSATQQDKLKPSGRTCFDYKDLQMAYKGFRTQEERNFFAYSRLIQNRFQLNGSNRVQTVGLPKYDPGMVAVVNISKPVRLRSRYCINPQLECE